MHKLWPSALLLVFLCPSVFAQHIDIDKKALAFLASQEKVNVSFTFNDLTISGKEIPEQQFLKERFAELSERKDEQEAGEWSALYLENKNKIWQEDFMETLIDRTAEYENSPKFVRNDGTAPYTMRVNTDWIYFGYNVIVGKNPSKVSFTVDFYQSEKPSNVLFSTEINRAMGTNNEAYNLSNWPSFRRVGKAYTKAAHKLARALKRILD